MAHDAVCTGHTLAGIVAARAAARRGVAARSHAPGAGQALIQPHSASTRHDFSGETRMSSDPSPHDVRSTDTEQPLNGEVLSASTPPTVVTYAPTARTLLQALRRRWLLATTLGVVAGVAAFVAAWSLLPAPPHTARSLLHIAAAQPRVLFKTSEYRPDANAFRQTQLALVKSRLVLNAALRQPKVADLTTIRKEPDPIAWLEKELKVTYTSSPEILSVTLSGDPPDELKTIVDAVVTAYLQEIVNKEQIKRQARLDQLEKISIKYQ